MTEYEDDENREDEETMLQAAADAAKRPTSLVMKVEGWEADRLVDAVATRLLQGLDKRVQDAIDAKVEEVVGAALETIATDRIKEELEKVLKDGWTPTNEYGKATGPAKTLKDRIGELLQYHERYGSRERWLDACVTKAVQEHLGGAFGEEIAAARASFKKQVDDLLSGKIASGLREAFGLSR